MVKPAKAARKHAQDRQMSPACDHYMVMKAASRTATEKVVRLIQDLRRFSAPLLADWSKCYVDISGMATPPQMAVHRKAISGDAVPSVQDLRQALINQFETQLGATQAWDVLSPDEQKALEPPPWIKK